MGTLPAVAAGALIGCVALAGVASGETIQEQNLVVTVRGGVTPKRLPRHRDAPVRVRVEGEIGTTDGLAPPDLKQFEIEVNRHGHVFDRGLPTCRRGQLETTTTSEALRRCGPALVGRGHVSADIALPDQAPFPAEGTLLAFNARIDGHRAVFGHVYGRVPVPVTT